MLDDASMSKVGFAMGCIAFSDDDLDACLLDIHELLSRFLPHLAEIDPELARMAVAQSLALAAALKNIHDVEALEMLMLTVGFFGEPDEPDLMMIKAIGLDQALHEAAKLEDAGDYPEAAADAERLEHLRSSTAKVMRSRGFGARYYTFLAQSEQA
jgi:hypothetical protein